MTEKWPVHQHPRQLFILDVYVIVGWMCGSRGMSMNIGTQYWFQANLATSALLWQILRKMAEGLPRKLVKKNYSLWSLRWLHRCKGNIGSPSRAARLYIVAHTTTLYHTQPIRYQGIFEMPPFQRHTNKVWNWLATERKASGSLRLVCAHQPKEMVRYKLVKKVFEIDKSDKYHIGRLHSNQQDTHVHTYECR